jgi:hypothetical protein
MGRLTFCTPHARNYFCICNFQSEGCKVNMNGDVTQIRMDGSAAGNCRHAGAGCILQHALQRPRP